jgi:glutathione S-transferase
MLLLYHSQPTGNSYKVRLLLSILQIPYAAIEVDIFNGGNKTAAYRSINPLGKAPALKLEDGSILTESNAILSYLASGTEYFPSDRLLGARVLQWMFFEQYSHLPYIGMARYYLHLLKQAPPRADDLSTWHLRGNIALEIMDASTEKMDQSGDQHRLEEREWAELPRPLRTRRRIFGNPVGCYRPHCSKVHAWNISFSG